MGSFLDKLLTGIHAVWHNGLAVTPRAVVNFVGGTVADNPTLSTTDVLLGGGSTVSGITTIEDNGSARPQEPIINFIGFTVADNPGATRTDVTSPSFTSIAFVYPIVGGNQQQLFTTTSVTDVTVSFGVPVFGVSSVPPTIGSFTLVMQLTVSYRISSASAAFIELYNPAVSTVVSGSTINTSGGAVGSFTVVLSSNITIGSANGDYPGPGSPIILRARCPSGNTLDIESACLAGYYV